MPHGKVVAVFDTPSGPHVQLRLSNKLTAEQLMKLLPSGSLIEFRHAATVQALVETEKAPAVTQEQQEPEQEKGGPLAKFAGQLCKSPEFWRFLKARALTVQTVSSEDQAAAIVRGICFVGSRAHLDSNPSAAKLFNDHIRQPFLKWSTQR